MIEVILCKDINKLGKAGEVIKVKDGYARNFLIPRNFALKATQANLKKIEEEKKHQLLQKEQEKKQAEELANKISGLSCTVAVEAMEDDKLYGAIREIDIAKALEQEGYNIDKKLIQLDQPIESIGIYDVTIKFHPEVTAKVRIWVTRK